MSRKRGAVLTAVILSTLLALAGCASPSGGSAAPEGGSVTVASAYGEVAVPAQPQRVASVAYYTLWQLWSVGVTPVAALDYTQRLDSFSDAQKAKLDESEPIGTFREINFERLTATKPDLIIGDATDVDEATYRRLSAIAPTVIAGGGSARGDWQQITKEIAAAVGKTEAWEKSKASYETLRDKTIADYREVIEGNKWAVFSLAEPGQFSLQLPGGATGNLIVNELGMTLAPSVPLDDPDAKGWQAYPLEQVPTVFRDVTYALTFAKPDGTIYEQIQTIIDSPIFQTTQVARTHSITALAVDVNDYESAQQFVTEITRTVLEPLRK